MMKSLLSVLAITVAMTGFGFSGNALAAGDAAEGAKVFRKCGACHTFDPSKRRTGPHLVGIIGRTAGTVEGFRYSEGMVNSGIVWDVDTLTQYLAGPRDMVPRSSMVFRLRDEKEIADVIAYIAQEGGS